MRKTFYILSVAFSFVLLFLFALPLKAQSLSLSPDQIQELRLTLDLAFMELRSLQTQLAISQEKLEKAAANAKQLNKELDTAKRYSTELQAQRDNYSLRLADTEKRRHRATIAGVLFGISIGIGVSLATTGAIIKSPPLTWSGVGVGGSALLTWIVGYCLQVW